MDQPTEPHATAQAAEPPTDHSEALTPAPSGIFTKMGSWIAHPRAPFVFLGAALAVVVAYIGISHYRPHGGSFSFGGHSIVLFDPVKFSNAQRAAVSVLQTTRDADLALTMTQVAKQAESVIEEEAGGALVLVKQTVVIPGDIPDITDAVLLRFGLPTNVPTVTVKPGEAAEALEYMAPTDSTFSNGKLREDYLLQLGERNARIADQNESRESQANVLP
ncbi:hypothetical protein ACOTHJ_15260 [Achromobacter xylosoxidans]